MRPEFGRHDRVARSRVNGDLDLVPLRRAHDTDRTLAHLREDVQSGVGLNSLDVLVDLYAMGLNVLVKTNLLRTDYRLRGRNYRLR